MPPEQSREQILRSPHLEAFKAKGYEVLLLTDPVDEVWVGSVTEFDGKPLQSVSKVKWTSTPKTRRQPTTPNVKSRRRSSQTCSTG